MEQGRALVRDPTALQELSRSQELQQRATRVDEEIAHLLDPLRGRLGALVLERDRLSYEALAARQKFFQAAKRVDPSLNDHASLRFEKREERVYVVWDDFGPRFSDGEGAELPGLHVFTRRGPGRRALDLMFKLG